MIEEPDDYFALGCGRCARFGTEDCSARRWSSGLATLRDICLEAGLVETAKWGHPCYMHAGRNIALIGAFQGDFRLTFFNAALLSDPDGILERPGPNTRHASMIRFVDDAGPQRQRDVIASYLEEAIDHAKAGRRPPKAQIEVDLPDELADALDADPEMAEAFDRLTPGRQRSYVINLTSAKKPETRIARIAKFRSRILAGKGANER